ncbi:hypothetical protein SBRCBS47491_007465 [Sporothrix bragantina]|uniref:Cyclase n=1 Tax=Sporothrix bragantina TaxID=671064 RepID=A0ABP0CDE5_9PEZI
MGSIHSAPDPASAVEVEVPAKQVQVETVPEPTLEATPAPAETSTKQPAEDVVIVEAADAEPASSEPAAVPAVAPAETFIVATAETPALTTVEVEAPVEAPAEVPVRTRVDDAVEAPAEAAVDPPVEVTAPEATSEPVEATETAVVAPAEKPVDLHALKYDELPDKRRVWPGAPGSREEGLGRLCLLTPDVVASAAASSIRTGQRVALNWDLTKLDIANFNRAPTQHHIMSLLGGAGFDDVYIFNPQQSSQWDGLRHFSSPYEGSSERLFYGGVTSGDIANRSNTRIGMQHWAQEGIVGRGVLLDYVEYARTHLPDLKYKALSDHAIPLSVLLDIARVQNVTFQRGDILFVRIGLTREWDDEMGPADKLAYAQSKNPQHAGVEGTEEMLRWIWDTGFAAVAGDAVSFEVYPPQKEYSRGEGQPTVPGVFMHEYLLPAWGVPVGELFDLEALSRMCIAQKRWTFFVTSSPLNMPGGVSSPPNCLAIF